MKTAKSPKSEEVTPSKKVLKQARLPFKLISDVSPKTNTTRPRKRKLSTTDTESANKIGKIKDQNKEVDVCVVISDDDSKDGSKTQNKTVNPFVKIVDVARKKKLQKSKSKKKKSAQSKPSVESNSSETNGTANDSEVVSIDTDNDSVSAMEVDCPGDQEQSVEEKSDRSCKEQSTDKSSKKQNTVKLSEELNTVDSSKEQNTDLLKEKSERTHCNGNSEADLTQHNTDDEKDASDHEKDVSDHEEKTEISSVEPASLKRRRSRRNETLNTTQASKANESVSSNPTTPKRSNRSSSVTNSNGDTSLNESSNTNITPKQQQKKLESAKKKEEREKERLEREKKRQQEKDERARQKQEKDEQKKREKEEKEEAKRKEKEEKEKQKELEKKLREEKEEQKRKEKEEKEEQKRKEREEKEEQKRKEKEAKEEEKRKKQEALEQEKLEQEQKKKKAAEAFVSFFVPKQKVEKDQPTVSKNDRLSSFTIKSDMRLAPTIRTELSDDKKKELESLLSKQSVDKKKLYVHELREGKKPQTSGKTWPLSDKDDDDVMIVEDELPPVDAAGEIQTCEPTVREKLRPKLLAFHENRRPPYWGTWRKKSGCIKPTQPFKMDQKLLDYDVDSDEEWEEEQEGESIDGSAAGSDDEPEDDYEVDNEVFVPHGYLSDEEATMDDDDVMSLSPETQKAKLKHLEDEFETQMKKPTEKLKPRMYGLLWVTEDGGKPDNCADVLWNYFGKLAMIMDDPTPLLQPSTDQEDNEKKKVKKKKVTPEGEKQDSPKSEKKKKPKQNDKEIKKPKEVKKAQEPKKNQRAINSFLTKLNNTT